MSQDDTSTIYYLQAEFSVTREEHHDFVLVMDRLLSVIFDEYQWELVHASYPISGEINRFTHIWRIPEPADVLRVMRHGAFELAEDEKRGAKTRRRRYFRELYLILQGLVSDTKHTLTTALPTDPIHTGFQSQTLLIQENEQDSSKHAVFVIDHRELRERWGEYDLGEEFKERRLQKRLKEKKPNGDESEATSGVEPQGEATAAKAATVTQLLARVEKELGEAPPDTVVRTSKTTRTTNVNEESNVKTTTVETVETTNAEGYAGQAAVAAERMAEELEVIQDLLDVGVTSAVVACPAHKNEDALLVNLSALKAKSVLQKRLSVDTPSGEKNAVVATLPISSSSETALKELLIATPWGGLYHLDSEALRQVARPIVPEQEAAARKQTKHLISGRVPIASVPEWRDGTIGDGCACYVINLSAFASLKKVSR